MSNIAIRVDRLSKQYKIGLAMRRYDTLRDQVTDGLLSIFRSNGHGSATAQRSDSSDTIWALKDISFEIKQGEVVGFIGRNGAGKSTLLKILSRITEPTSGRAEIFGRVGSLLEVGTGFHGELTGRENVYLNGAILGMKKWEIDKKFDEIVAFSEIDKFIDTPVKRYSSGMYVRLAFAVAAHLEPDILIVDEVLAVGDAAFQKKCLGKMGDVAKEGRTVLFVSHNMGAIQVLCSRGILLFEGQLLEDGNCERTIASYLRRIGFDSNKRGFLDETFREGSGRLKFKHACLLDASGKEVTTARSGDPISLMFDYTCPVDGVPGDDIVFSITITDEQYGRLILHKSSYIGKVFFDVPRQGRVVCSLPRLPLVGGRYWLGVNASTADEELDNIPAALELNVLESDYHGAGVLPMQGHSPILIEGDWKLLATD